MDTMDHNEAPESELLSSEKVRRILDISKTTFFDLVWSGDLPAKKIRRRIYVSRTDLDAFIAALPSASRTDGSGS
jgi:excisionase family DNA binding protein